MLELPISTRVLGAENVTCVRILEKDKAASDLEAAFVMFNFESFNTIIFHL